MKIIFKEWVIYRTEQEKEDAYIYLALWKKFLLIKEFNKKQVGFDQIVDRPNGLGEGNHTLGIKIKLENE